MSQTLSSYQNTTLFSVVSIEKSEDTNRHTTLAHLLYAKIPLVEVALDVGCSHQAANRSTAVYTVEVCTKFNKYRVGRRYNEFFQLYSKLQDVPGFSYNQFPPKTWFQSLNSRFLEQRRTQLEAFLAHAIAFAQDNGLRFVFDFIEFNKFSALR